MDLNITSGADGQIEIENVDMISALESILFAWAEPISLRKLASVLEIPEGQIKTAIESLKKRYSHPASGIELFENDGLYYIGSRHKNSEYVEKLFGANQKRTLSNAALEVLAIIALRQPITRAGIDEIRGVNSGGALQALILKDLVYVSGRLDRIGKPQVYSTTDKFLKSFNISGLDELPGIDDIEIL